MIHPSTCINCLPLTSARVPPTLHSQLRTTNSPIGPQCRQPCRCLTHMCHQPYVPPARTIHLPFISHVVVCSPKLRVQTPLQRAHCVACIRLACNLPHRTTCAKPSAQAVHPSCAQLSVGWPYASGLTRFSVGCLLLRPHHTLRSPLLLLLLLRLLCLLRLLLIRVVQPCIPRLDPLQPKPVVSLRARAGRAGISCVDGLGGVGWEGMVELCTCAACASSSVLHCHGTMARLASPQ